MSYQSDVSVDSNTALVDLGNLLGFLDVDGGALTLFPAPTLAGRMQDSSVSGYSFVQYYSFAPYDDTSLLDVPFPIFTDGLITQNQASAPMNAVGFTSQRTSRRIRRSFRRLSGYNAGAYAGAGRFTDDYIALRQLLADTFGETVTSVSGGQTVNYTPIIESKEPYTTPSGKTAYRNWPDELVALQNTTPTGDWVVNPQVTTQNSRKRGAGA
jgi:hypothetical protein